MYCEAVLEWLFGCSLFYMVVVEVTLIAEMIESYEFVHWGRVI